MCPREEPLQPQSKDEALGRLWDALQESGTLGSPEIESEDIDTITRLHGAEDVPPPGDELIQRMWGVIETGALGSAPLQAGALLPNGHHAAVARLEPEIAFEAPKPALRTESQPGRLRLTAIARSVAIAVAAGFIVGFITLGAGGRIAMRIAAILSADELQGTITENNERVGEITLSGTFNLMMTGGWIGIALGLGFLSIRAYLPRSGWRRIAVSGAVYFAVCGFVTLEGGENRDYEKFGIAGLNVCLFTLLPLFFGLLIVPVADRLDRHVGRDLPRLSRSPRVLVTSAGILFLSLLAVPGLMFLLILPPLQLFIVMPLLVAIARFAGDRLSVDPSSGVSIWLARATLAVPCIVGLALTALAVGRIM